MDHRGRPSWELTSSYAVQNPGGVVLPSLVVDTQPALTDNTAVSGDFVRYGVEFVDPFSEVRLYGEVISGGSGKLVLEAYSGTTWVDVGTDATPELDLSDVGFVIGAAVARRNTFSGDVVWRVRAEGAAAITRMQNVAVQWVKGLVVTVEPPPPATCDLFVGMKAIAPLPRTEDGYEYAYYDDLCGYETKADIEAEGEYDHIPYKYDGMVTNGWAGGPPAVAITGADAINGVFSMRDISPGTTTYKAQQQYWNYLPPPPGEEGHNFWLLLRMRFSENWATTFDKTISGATTFWDDFQLVYSWLPNYDDNDVDAEIFINNHPDRRGISYTFGTIGNEPFYLTTDPTVVFTGAAIDVIQGWRLNGTVVTHFAIIRHAGDSVTDGGAVICKHVQRRPITATAIKTFDDDYWGFWTTGIRSHTPLVADTWDWGGYCFAPGFDPFNTGASGFTVDLDIKKNVMPNADFQRSDWSDYRNTINGNNPVTTFLSPTGGSDGGQAIRLETISGEADDVQLRAIIPQRRVGTGSRWTISGLIKWDSGANCRVTTVWGTFSAPIEWRGDGLYHAFSLTSSSNVFFTFGEVYRTVTLQVTGSAVAYFDKFQVEMGVTATTWEDDV